MSNKQLTIKITRTADDCYIADIVELKNAVVLAESLKDLFEAIQFTIETVEQESKNPVPV